MDSPGHSLFNKIHWWLVTSTIFVHCQQLIARKMAKLFGFNHGVRPFYAACLFDELIRGSVSCLLNASFGKQFHNATTWFLSQNWWPWCPPGQYRANTSPMTVSNGISGGHRRAALGDAHVIAPVHHHGHQNDPWTRSWGSGYIVGF
jgi:hypothetical protein